MLPRAVRKAHHRNYQEGEAEALRLALDDSRAIAKQAYERMLSLERQNTQLQAMLRLRTMQWQRALDELQALEGRS